MKLTYQTNLKPVYRVREKEVTREEKESRQNLWETVDTGNHYYGARYYNSNLSIWLSVDPDAEKYPHISPFNFVENCPTVFLDPNGKGPIHPRSWSRISTVLMASKGLNILSTGPMEGTGPYKLDGNLLILSGGLNFSESAPINQLFQSIGGRQKSDNVAEENPIYRSTDGIMVDVSGNSNTGGVQAIKEAALTGNYLYKTKNGKNNFTVTEVLDGIISTEYSFTNNNGTFQLSSKVEYNYEYQNPRVVKESFEDKTILYRVYDVQVTETRTNLENGERSTETYIHEGGRREVIGTE